VISKIRMRGGRLEFRDSAVSMPFSKEIDKFDLDLYLSLPDKLEFDAAFQIKSELPVKIKSSGRYDISAKSLSAKITAGDIPPEEFIVYYNKFGFTLTRGRLDCRADILYKDGVLNADIEAETKNIVFSNGDILARFDSGVTASISYNPADKTIKYSGDLTLPT